MKFIIAHSLHIYHKFQSPASKWTNFAEKWVDPIYCSCARNAAENYSDSQPMAIPHHFTGNHYGLVCLPACPILLCPLPFLQLAYSTILSICSWMPVYCNTWKNTTEALQHPGSHCHLSRNIRAGKSCSLPPQLRHFCGHCWADVHEGPQPGCWTVSDTQQNSSEAPTLK